MCRARCMSLFLGDALLFTLFCIACRWLRLRADDLGLTWNTCAQMHPVVRSALVRLSLS